MRFPLPCIKWHCGNCLVVVHVQQYQQQYIDLTESHSKGQLTKNRWNAPLTETITWNTSLNLNRSRSKKFIHETIRVGSNLSENGFKKFWTLNCVLDRGHKSSTKYTPTTVEMKWMSIESRTLPPVVKKCYRTIFNAHWLAPLYFRLQVRDQLKVKNFAWKK